MHIRKHEKKKDANFGSIIFFECQKKKQLYVWLICLAALHNLHGNILTRPTVLCSYHYHSAGQLLLFSAPKYLVPCGTLWVFLFRKDKLLQHSSRFGVEWSSMGLLVISTILFKQNVRHHSIYSPLKIYNIH